LIGMNTPEEAELTAKKAELASLCELLAEKELDLTELKLAVARFEHRYFSEVGRKYVELDELKAQIAELRAQENRDDHHLSQEAIRARTQARTTAEEYKGVNMEPRTYSAESEKSEDVKKLYRQIASLIHPDKATDDGSRRLRTRLMAELNDAYARKDIMKMQNILGQWQESPEAVPGEGTGAELVRTIRAISQIKRRICQIEMEISEITTSDIHLLMLKVHHEDSSGRNVLAELSACVNSEIQNARNELSSLKG